MSYKQIYRRKPKKVRIERIFVWIRWDNGGLGSHQFLSSRDVESFFHENKGAKELKRQIVWVEVEE